jgi:ATP-dependent Clp protease ATP-binding subunit ClpX
MYDLPSLRNARKVVVDEAVVTGETRPYIIFESDDSASLRPVAEGRRAAGSGSH